MTNRIWVAVTIIVVVAGYGLSHKVERVAPKPSGVLFK